MKTPIALVAAFAFLGSTTLVTAFFAPRLDQPSHVQFAQDKMKDDKMKADAMKDDKMAKDKMEKDKMEKDKMMKDDKTKK
jgi:pentapeptide MXKDX repeat protein